MSFFEDITTARLRYSSLSPDNLCFECGQPVDKAGVQYEGIMSENTPVSIVLHANCASIMGQRLIADGYVHRRKS